MISMANNDALAVLWRRFELDRRDIDARNALWSHYTPLADAILSMSLAIGWAQQRDVSDLQGHLYAAIPAMLDKCEPATDEAFQRYGAGAMQRQVRGWYRTEARNRGVSLDTPLAGTDNEMIADTLAAPTEKQRMSVADLEKITKGMPLRCQVAMYFRYVVGWSPSRTARVTHENTHTVSSRLVRAHKWLRGRHDRQFMLDTLLNR